MNLGGRFSAERDHALDEVSRPALLALRLGLGVELLGEAGVQGAVEQLA